MKVLMLGNEAVARGLYEAGCAFVSSYPGTPSTEITEAIAKYPEVYAEWAPNEKVAMEAAFGASLAGRRSFCGMKHVGLNVAADPLFTIAYTGVNAGMVIGVADDAVGETGTERDQKIAAADSEIGGLGAVKIGRHILAQAAAVLLFSIPTTPSIPVTNPDTPGSYTRKGSILNQHTTPTRGRLRLPRVLSRIIIRTNIPLLSCTAI